jgi:4-amino-4-deoxy-L-arabinose transferase-like glycosyltransferase
MTGASIAKRAGWLLLLILVLAAVLRFPALDRVPPGFQFDEGYNAIDAQRVLQGDRPVFLPANGGREVLYTYLQALVMGVLGADVIALRFTSALVGVLGIAATFFFVRLVWDSGDDRKGHTVDAEAQGNGESSGATEATLVALLASTFMAVTYWHLHFSRYGIRAITLPLLEVMLFYAFWRGYRSRKPFWWVAGGILLGLGPYTHPAGRFLPFIITIFVLYKILTCRTALPVLLWQWATMTVVSGAVFIPLAIYFWSNPGALTGHASLVWVFNPEISGGDSLSMIAQNVLSVLGMFAWRGDGAWNHNLAGRPVWGPLAATCFAIGVGVMAFRLFRRGEPPTRPRTGKGTETPRDKYVFWVVWLAVMFTPTLLSSGAPDFSRSIGAIPAVCLIPALGLVSMGKWLRPKRWLVTTAIVAAVLFTTAYGTIKHYFVVFPRVPDLYHIYDVDKIEVVNHLQDLVEEGQVYLSPLWSEHATVDFLTLGLDLKSFDSGETLVLPARSGERDAVYVFSWEQTPYIQSFAERMGPLAERVDIPNVRGGKLLVTFLVPAGKLPELDRPIESLTEERFPLMPAQRTIHSPTVFGGKIALLGYTLPDEVPAGGAEPVILFWQALGDMDEDYTVFLHAVDGRGRRWGQDDRRPNQGGYPTPVWNVGDVIVDQYWPTIDPCAPEGNVQLIAGLYNLETGERLTVDATGRDSEPLDQVEIVPPRKLDLRDRKPNRELVHDWNNLRLLGIDALPEEVVSGAALPIDLFWKAQADLSEDYTWQLDLLPISPNGAAVALGPIVPLVPTSRWRKGDGVCTHYDIAIPRETPSGTYTLALSALGLEGEVDLGGIRIEYLPRSFVVPEHLGRDDLPPLLDVHFGESIRLRGYDLPDAHLKPGDELGLTLYWQADGPVGQDDTVFVHLLDDGGVLRSQWDSAPVRSTRPTSGWLPGEVISDTVVLPLPPDLPRGTYRISVGMYQPLIGQRLPVFGAEWQPLPDARLILDRSVEVAP